MSTTQIPEHLQAWWHNQYQTVREFCQALFNGQDQAAVANTIAFIETLSRYHPKMRSVRLTNAAHALWQSVPSKLAFEIGMKHYPSPAEVHGFIQLAQPALTLGEHAARFEKELTIDSTPETIRAWLGAQKS